MQNPTEIATPTQIAKLYDTWAGIVYRCTNPKSKSYSDYGGRGIKICDRWLESFDNFFYDMGPKPSPDHSIDRKDVNGDYCPENCRWATFAVQARNKRSNIYLTHNGKTQHLLDWAEETGIPWNTIRARIQRDGMTDSEALTTPVRESNKLYSFDGKKKTLRQWSVDLDIPLKVLKTRVQERGWPIDRALTEPVAPDNRVMITHDGKTQCIADWARDIGIKENTLRVRLKKGWSVEKALLGSVRNTHRYIEHNGITKTIGEWATYSGLDESTIRRRLEMGITDDRLFQKGRMIKPHNPKASCQ